MAPTIASDYVANRAVGAVESSCDFLSAEAGGVQSNNLPHLCVCEGSAVMLLAAFLASLFDSIAGIICSVAEKEMRWIHARRIVTTVKHALILAERAVLQFP